MDLPTCEKCGRPTVGCVCDRVVVFDTVRRVLVLQHPQEKDAVLGSAQILAACLPKAKIVVGLSWPNFAAALGEEGVDPRKWAVLFPDKESPGNEVTGRKGALADASELDGIVVLDGTWSKAKTLWWRNPWLLKLKRLPLQPREPSIYGSLRQEPRRDLVSTLESVAQALTLAGEPPEVEAGLRRIFRTMVQRVRDAKIIPPRSRPHGRTRPQARKPKAESSPADIADQGRSGGED